MLLLGGIPKYPGAGSQTFSTPGTHQFTVPSGVFSIVVAMWGGGGGGYAYYNYNSYYFGGGGGAFTLGVAQVKPKQVVPVVVGAGGVGGITGLVAGVSYSLTFPTDGGDSSVLGVVAKGGQKGVGTSDTVYTPVNGGPASDYASGILLSIAGSAAPRQFSPYSGHTGTSFGGGAASILGVITGTAGGTGWGAIPAGGAGGSYINETSDASGSWCYGTDGTAPGGGGAAANEDSSSDGAKAGNGGDGMVMIFW